MHLPLSKDTALIPLDREELSWLRLNGLLCSGEIEFVAEQTEQVPAK